LIGVLALRDPARQQRIRPTRHHAYFYEIVAANEAVG